MKINGGSIHVEIGETYRGSCHYRLKIRLPGFGLNHSGFILCSIDNLKNALGDNWADFVGDTTLRPEYAKAIKKALEAE